MKKLLFFCHCQWCIGRVLCVFGEQEGNSVWSFTTLGDSTCWQQILPPVCFHVLALSWTSWLWEAPSCSQWAVLRWMLERLQPCNGQAGKWRTNSEDENCWKKFSWMVHRSCFSPSKLFILVGKHLPHLDWRAGGVLWSCG